MDPIRSPLYDFCAQKALRRLGALRLHAAYRADPQGGNLYGATRTGGQNGGGVVFELSPPAKGQTAWTEKVLYSFCARGGCADGSQPSYRLTYAGAVSGAPYDGSSPIYGVTIDGGNDTKSGILYSLTPKKNGWSEKSDLRLLFRGQLHRRKESFGRTAPRFRWKPLWRYIFWRRIRATAIGFTGSQARIIRWRTIFVPVVPKAASPWARLRSTPRSYALWRSDCRRCLQRGVWNAFQVRSGRVAIHRALRVLSEAPLQGWRNAKRRSDA